MPEALAGAPAPAAAPIPAATDGIQPQTSEPAGEGQPANEGTQHEDSEKRQSRYRRRLDRERERRIQAETRLQMLTEQQRSQAAPQQAAPKGDEEPKREQFESYEDYVEARATYRAEKKASEIVDRRFNEAAQRRQQEAAQQTARERQASWNKGLESARKKYDDFDDVTDNDEIVIQPKMGEAISDSPIGPELVYFLGKNPDEAERIAVLPAREQYAEMVLLERRVRDMKPAAKVSQAPEPINPVGGKAGVQDDTPNASKDDLAAWMRKRNKQVHGPRK